MIRNHLIDDVWLVIDLRTRGTPLRYVAMQPIHDVQVSVHRSESRAFLVHPSERLRCNHSTTCM